jgi:hypothetical protein
MIRDSPSAVTIWINFFDRECADEVVTGDESDDTFGIGRFTGQEELEGKCTIQCICSRCSSNVFGMVRSKAFSRPFLAEYWQ